MNLSMSSLIRYAELGLGAYVGWYLNDNYATPFAEKLLPDLQTNHTLAKVQDTGTMALTSVGLGAVGHLLGLHRAADAVAEGGLFVTILKAFTIPFAGLEAKLTVPNPLSLFRSQMAVSGGQSGSGNPGSGASPTKQLPAAGGTSGTSGASANTRPITASPLSDYGSRVAPTMDAGF